MINSRLLTILNLINPNSTGIIDVGTDHGYLPIELANRGFKGNILASDIRRKPLDVAIKNAEKYNVSKKIIFSLSDGLNSCNPALIDTIVIAGMGGDVICDIIDRAEWTMNSFYTLFLQPMSRYEVLRYWLTNNGYKIKKEYFVMDMGRPYSILEVSFTNENEYYTDGQLYVGKNPSTEIVKKEIRYLQKKPSSNFNDKILEELRKYVCK